MKEEIRQYYESLIDKDNDKTKYYFDVCAENSDSGLKIQMANVQQNARKCTGAANFKQIAETAERRHYNILYVTEYGADTTTVVSKYKFDISRSNRSQKKNNSPAKVESFGGVGLQGFNQQLGVLGFQDGIAGMIDASAKKLANEDRLMRLEAENIELKNKISQMEQKCENFKNETEKYKDKYKDIQDDMKELKRENKNKIEKLENKLSFSSLAVQGLLGFAAKKTPLGGILSGLMSNDSDSEEEEEEAQTPTDEEESETSIAKVDPETQQYLNAINKYVQTCGPENVKKLAVIFQFITIPGKLEYLVKHCQQEYLKSQNPQNS